MKNKIFNFIIGMLVDVILATLGFYIYTKNVEKNAPEFPKNQKMINGERPDDDARRGNRPDLQNPENTVVDNESNTNSI